MKNKNDISREMLIRYLNGELSDNEAWKVEKAIQDDPFLADAMEGLEMAMQKGGVSEDLEELDRRIALRKEEVPKSYFTPFMRIAAVILVLAVSIAGIYQLFSPGPSTRDELALQKNEMKKDTAAGTTYNDGGTAQPVQPSERIPDKSKGRSDISKVNPATSEETKIRPPVTPEQAKPAVPEKENYASAEREADATQEQPVGNALATKAQGVIADSSQIPEVTPQSTSGMEVPSAVSSEVAAGAMKKESKYAMDRAARSKSYAAGDETLAAGINQSHPVPGDSAYLKYIISNLRYPATARQKGVEGDVTVGFTVKADSTLSNFSILKGIGSGCNEEAIRLIRQGPHWVPQFVNGKPEPSKVVYNITFRLNP